MSDLISRSALLEEFAGSGFLLESIVRHCIEKAPAVDAEPVRHGEWEYVRTDKYNGEFAVVKCSSCGHTNYAIAEYIRKGIWCPYCGAKMRGDNDAAD